MRLTPWDLEIRRFYSGSTSLFNRGYRLCDRKKVTGIETNMSVAKALVSLKDHRYINLETFRRNGQGVRTPVWFAADPSSGQPLKLYVYSTADSGKGKRIRNNPRVRVAPCDMRGRLLEDWVEARAEIVTGDQAQRGSELLERKYFPWKQLLDFFAMFRRKGHIVFVIGPA